MTPVRISRIVLDRTSAGSTSRFRSAVEAASDLLEEECDILVSPGGFLSAPWPDGWNGTTGWGSEPPDLEPVRASAEDALARAWTRPLLKRLRRRARWMTVGIDLFAKPEAGSDHPHAELVAIVDVETGAAVAWTGKSYPTRYQEQTLVHEARLESHLVKFGGWRVLVLGCHDLNMFSPRSRANQTSDSRRRRVCDQMRTLATAFRPEIVLQHPHTTDSPRIWQQGWAGVRKALPGASSYVGGVCFRNPWAQPRAKLESVLRTTRQAAGEDVVVDEHLLRT